MSNIIITEKSALDRLDDKRNLCLLLGKKKVHNSLGSQSYGSSVLDKEKDLTDPSSLNRINQRGENREGQRRNFIPEEMKAVIGALTKVENGVAVGNNLGVSEVSAVRFSRGLVTPSKFSESLAQEVNEKAEELTEGIRNRALDRLSSALNHITDEELANGKLREKAGVAKDMAVVFEKLGPKMDLTAGITFNVYVPKQKLESDYPTQTVDAEIVKR